MGIQVTLFGAVLASLAIYIIQLDSKEANNTVPPVWKAYLTLGTFFVGVFVMGVGAIWVCVERFGCLV